MELKSVTVQLKVGGRDETHELTWNAKAKAYVSASGTVKVPDPKAKNVQVLVRKDVTKDRWDKFTGKCSASTGSEEICEIKNKNRQQQIKQITVRFAPTAKAAEASRGWIADYQYTDPEVKEKIAEWVTDKIGQGELKAPPAKHIQALEKQLKGLKLTKDELWIKLEIYTQMQRESVARQKPLFKLKPRPLVDIVIKKPKPAKPEKPITVSKELANAKTAQDRLDRVSQKVDKATPKTSIKEFRTMFLDVETAGEKVWAAMQQLKKSKDPAAAAKVKDLEAARNKYHDAENKIYNLLQLKAANTIAELEKSRTAIAALAKKSPPPAEEFQKAKRDFKRRADLAYKEIVSTSKSIVLPGEKSSPGAERILDRLKTIATLRGDVDKIALAQTAPSAPPTEPVPASAHSPVIKNANQRLSQLQRQLAFLPDRIFGQASDYDKDKMDRLYNVGRFNRLSYFAAQVKKASDDINRISPDILDSNPNVRLALNTLTDKVAAAQAYLILEHIDKNPVMANKYPATEGAARANYAWLEDANQRTAAVKEARALLKSLSVLMGPSNAKKENQLKWSYDIIMTSISGQYPYGYKAGWERAKTVLSASYNYQMYKRTPYRAPQETGRPSGKTEATPPPPSYPASVQLAFNAVKRAYASLYLTTPMGDKDRKFIFEDEVPIIAKQLDDASKQMDAVSIDDSHGHVAQHYSKLTKARGLYNILKEKPEKRIPALLNEARQYDKQVAEESTDAGLGASKRKLYQLKDRLQSLGRIREAGMNQVVAVLDRAIAKADQKIAKIKGLPPPTVLERKQGASDATHRVATAEQRAAHLRYIPIRNNLSAAIAEANQLYGKFFDENGVAKDLTLSAVQISHYRTQIQNLNRKLEVEINSDLQSKLSKDDQGEWDDLQPKKSIAQGYVSDVTIRLRTLEEALRTAKAPPSASAKPAAPAEQNGDLAAKDAPTLLEEVQRLRSMAVATDSLSDAAIHRDGIIAIVEEAHRRGMTSLEASAQRALKTVNAKVVELGGTEKKPRFEAAPLKPVAPTPESPAPSVVEPPVPATPTTADAAAQRRAAVAEKLRLAQEKKAKRDSALQETTQLKGRREGLEKELAGADSQQKLDEYEKEIKEAIGTLAGHEALIGPFAVGVKNTYDILLKRIPALREKLQAAERQSKINAEVSQLWSNAERLISDGEAILVKYPVNPADMPQLQRIKGELDGVESRLNQVFSGVPKEQDSLRTRIATHLGKIREVAGKIADRIQHLTALAKEDKSGSVERLRQEANVLIKSSKALRKKGSIATDQLKPILVQLAAIEKALEEIDKTLKDGDPLKERNFTLWAEVLQEIGSIEKIIGPLKPAIKPPTQPASEPKSVPQAAPLPGEPTPTAPAPTKGAAPEAAPTPPPPAVKTEPAVAKPVGPTVDLGTITGRISDYKARLSKTTENRDSSTNATALPELIALRKGIARDLSTVQSADPVEAAGITRGLQDIYFEVVAETASRLRMMSHTPQMKQLQYVLSQFEDLKKDLASIKGVNQDQLNAEIKAIDDSIAAVRQDIAQYEQENTPEKRIARLQERLNKLGTIRDIGGGKGIQLDSVTEEYFAAENERLFNGISAIYGKKPVKAVIQALQTDSPIGMAISMALFRKGVAGLPIADPRMPGSNAKIMLYFDAKDADQMAKIIQGEVADKIKADKQHLIELERKRIAPYRSLQAVLPGGSQTMEVREPGKPELYVSHVRVTDSAAALQLIRKVATTLKLDEQDDFFVFAHPNIANGLVNGSPAMDLRGSRVFGLTPATPGEIYIVTRSANAGFSIKHQFGEKEFLLKPYLQKMGAKKNVTFSSIASDTSIQRAQQRAASEAKAAQGLGVKVGSDREVAPAPAAPPQAAQPPLSADAAWLPTLSGLKRLDKSPITDKNAPVYRARIKDDDKTYHHKIGDILKQAKDAGATMVIIRYNGKLKSIGGAYSTSSVTFGRIKLEALKQAKELGLNVDIDYIQDSPLRKPMKPDGDPLDAIDYILLQDAAKANSVKEHYKTYIQAEVDRTTGH